MQHIYPVPSRGMTTDRCGIQRRRLRTIRDSRPRTTSNTPIATGHPHHHPPHAEIRDVPDSYLLPSVQPVAVEPALNVDEDIERHIGYDDEIRWFCIRCNEKSGNRKNRIRDHVAACLGYAIYPCTGGCGNPTWCVALSVDWASEILDTNYNVAVRSNAKRVRIFVSTSTLSAEYAHSGTSDFTLGAFADQHEFSQWRYCASPESEPPY